MTIQARGSLTSSSPTVVDLRRVDFPCSLTLRSAAGGRLIELSTDGVEYFTPAALDVTSSTQQVLVINRRVMYARLTGAASDTWSIV